MLTSISPVVLTKPNDYNFAFIIESSFLGPTNYRGSRATAVFRRDSDQTFRSITDWWYGGNSDQNHLMAVESVLQKLSDSYHDGEPWPFHYRVVSRGIGGRRDAYYWSIKLLYD